MTPAQIKQLQTYLNSQGASLKVDGIMGPLTNAAAEAHYNSGEVNTGVYGQPSSNTDQQTALDQGNKDWGTESGYFKDQQQYEGANSADILAQQQQNYNDQLIKDQTDFQTQKTGLDQTAAAQGVLFSGGRIQKQNNLKNTFDQAQTSAFNTASRGMNNTAKDFEYKYGTGSGNKNGLSQYYKLGSNSYNPNVATGGATSNGLSNIYNSGGANYQGTTVNTYKGLGQQRAADLLWNKGNKLIGNGSLY